MLGTARSIATSQPANQYSVGRQHRDSPHKACSHTAIVYASVRSLLFLYNYLNIKHANQANRKCIFVWSCCGFVCVLGSRNQRTILESYRFVQDGIICSSSSSIDLLNVDCVSAVQWHKNSVWLQCEVRGIVNYPTPKYTLQISNQQEDTRAVFQKSIYRRNFAYPLTSCCLVPHLQHDRSVVLRVQLYLWTMNSYWRHHRRSRSLRIKSSLHRRRVLWFQTQNEALERE